MQQIESALGLIVRFCRKFERSYSCSVRPHVATAGQIKETCGDFPHPVITARVEVIHAATNSPRMFIHFSGGNMDCRNKSGNDSMWVSSAMMGFVT